MSDKFMPELEWAGEKVSLEQVQRICSRYYWAGEYCIGKDVVEAACGTGIGSGYLCGISRSYTAGDLSEDVLKVCRNHYEDRIEFRRFDAHDLPFDDDSKDVIILFEAIYYLRDPWLFVKECKRVLRKGGAVLVATANKDLYDFHPSGFASAYHGVAELRSLFGACGFRTEFFGDTPMNSVSIRQRVLRPVKKLVVGLNLLPKTNAGKRMLKRLVFGGLVDMPHEITARTAGRTVPVRISDESVDVLHKVLFCAAFRV